MVPAAEAAAEEQEVTQAHHQSRTPTVTLEVMVPHQAEVAVAAEPMRAEMPTFLQAVHMMTHHHHHAVAADMTTHHQADLMVRVAAAAEVMVTAMGAAAVPGKPMRVVVVWHHAPAPPVVPLVLKRAAAVPVARPIHPGMIGVTTGAVDHHPPPWMMELPP